MYFLFIMFVKVLFSPTQVNVKPYRQTRGLIYKACVRLIVKCAYTKI